MTGKEEEWYDKKYISQAGVLDKQAYLSIGDQNFRDFAENYWIDQINEPVQIHECG